MRQRRAGAGAQTGRTAGRSGLGRGPGSGYATGFWGVPGAVFVGRVHLTYDGEPVCGAQMGPRAEFQWCAWGAELRFIDCKHCEQTARKLIAQLMPGRD